MADDHRRVEPRGIVGTGMLTDPERIAALEREAARRERAWRDAPERGFGAVLEEAPVWEPPVEEPEVDPRARAAAARAADEAPPPATSTASVNDRAPAPDALRDKAVGQAFSIGSLPRRVARPARPPSSRPDKA